ncbi:protein phosphatase 2C domain-containing protein [Hyphococcus sp. DH-69]|uniref:protein phosphatase 2C domain-containing protein n=1 Tax=Hyphococcus formosus TaxID=3143534 RepID=UPI00398AC26E
MSQYYISVLDAVCEKGNGRDNEDAVGWLPNAVWVLDGVSGLETSIVGGGTAARWYAQTFSAHFSRHMLLRPDAPTLSLINLAIDDCRSLWADLGQPDMAEPAATFAMLRLVDGQIELTSIGDSAIRFKDMEGRVTVFGDRSVEPFEQKTLDRLIALQNEQPDAPHSELSKALKSSQRNNRQYVNREDGYNVLTLSPMVPRNIVSSTLPNNAETDFLLTSDGFSRYTEVLEISDERAFFARAQEQSLGTILDEIRSTEQSDPDCRIHPRIKQFDDATALKVRVRNLTRHKSDA